MALVDLLSFPQGSCIISSSTFWLTRPSLTVPTSLASYTGTILNVATEGAPPPEKTTVFPTYSASGTVSATTITSFVITAVSSSGNATVSSSIVSAASSGNSAEIGGIVGGVVGGVIVILGIIGLLIWNAKKCRQPNGYKAKVEGDVSANLGEVQVRSINALGNEEFGGRLRSEIVELRGPPTV
jgi:hypothetical protein